MKAHPRVPQSQSAGSRHRGETTGYNAKSLAYEDVLSLATRLINKGYTEIGTEFLAFANNPNGLAAVYGLDTESRRVVLKPAVTKETSEAMAYLAAANLLVRSKTLRRDEVAQAVLLIAFGKADSRVDQDDDPPMFTD
jgi:hypothetical protein